MVETSFLEYGIYFDAIYVHKLAGRILFFSNDTVASSDYVVAS